MSLGDLSVARRTNMERLIYREWLIEETHRLTEEYENHDVYDLLLLMMKRTVSPYNKIVYINEKMKELEKEMNEEPGAIAFNIINMCTFGFPSRWINLNQRSVCGEIYDRASILYELLNKREEITPIDI